MTAALSKQALELVDAGQLSAKTRRMIKAIGIADTVVVLQARGGTYLDLPHGTDRRRPAQWLADLIGQTQAEQLTAAFADGAKRVLLPKPDKIIMQLRDAVICAELEEDSVPTVALRHRLHIRTVQLIRKRGPSVAADQVDTIQLSLFEPQGTSR